MLYLLIQQIIQEAHDFGESVLFALFCSPFFLFSFYRHVHISHLMLCPWRLLSSMLTQWAKISASFLRYKNIKLISQVELLIYFLQKDIIIVIFLWQQHRGFQLFLILHFYRIIVHVEQWLAINQSLLAQASVPPVQNLRRYVSINEIIHFWVAQKWNV